MSWLAGLAIAAGVLGVATGIGLWHRTREGRPRRVSEDRSLRGFRRAALPRRGESATGRQGEWLIPLAQRPQIHAESDSASSSPAAPPVLADLGVVPGTPATLLQFSSAFCARCRATRVLCRQVAAEVDGVRHREVDAESHLEAVRALRVWRTPTVFVVDAAGRPVARVTGQPTRVQLTEAVQPLLAPEVRS